MPADWGVATPMRLDATLRRAAPRRAALTTSTIQECGSPTPNQVAYTNIYIEDRDSHLSRDLFRTLSTVVNKITSNWKINDVKYSCDSFWTTRLFSHDVLHKKINVALVKTTICACSRFDQGEIANAPCLSRNPLPILKALSISRSRPPSLSRPLATISQPLPSIKKSIPHIHREKKDKKDATAIFFVAPRIMEVC